MKNFMWQNMVDYNFQKIEADWQEYWDKSDCFTTDDNSSKPKYYVLEMFPYPSGKAHMGHLRNYTLGDIIARFKKAQGFEVLHPMGWDSFGLPAENAAIAKNIHPAKWTVANIESMKKQFKPFGISYDWSREVTTCMPDYYKHEQAMFIDFMEAGLAYQKESVVNWDPIDNTVLANEQVENGRGWRSGALVERKKLKQWFLKITDFAEELLDDLKEIESGWPEKVITMQRNWIGKSYGAGVDFKLTNSKEKIKIFTTRPDTLFGAAFIAIASEHKLAKELSNDNQEIKDFIKECQQLGTSESAIETAEKKGFRTKLEVEHPFDKNIKLPVYIANFVLMEYGTGAVFGCPAHDERDHEFATKYSLPITQVVSNEEVKDIVQEPYMGDGELINSQFLNGLTVEVAKDKAIQELESLSFGKRVTQYRLRDWGVSRQRYWGCPIPVIHCDSCGTLPVPKQDLPISLPDDVSFDKTGNPLEYHPTWKNVECHKCKAKATRETDTFDTFFESSWYFARYCSPKNDNDAFDKDLVNKWLPVDQYIGGIEHAVMHLLYARFFTKALSKCSYMDIKEPFKALLTQGMITHETYKDKEGNWLYPESLEKVAGKLLHKDTGEEVVVGRIEKMSKSKNNTVDPGGIIEQYGADTARLFVLSDSPADRDIEWTDSGVEGAYKFISKLYKECFKLSDIEEGSEECQKTLVFIHKTINFVTEDLKHNRFNKAIARVRELVNQCQNDCKLNATKKAGYKVVVQLLNPMIPHVTEAIWKLLGSDLPLVDTEWPVADKKLLVDETITLAVQLNGKMRGTINIAPDACEETALKEAKELPNVIKMTEGKEIRKVIYVPKRIMNIICG